MSTVYFTPASSDGWIAVASGSRALVVAPGVDDSFVSAAVAAIGGPDGAQLLVDLLVAGGVDASPAFALLDWPGAGSSLRVVVRGGVAVSATTPAGDETYEGASGTPWFERTVPGVTAVSLVVAGAVAATAPVLPLSSGAAFIASLVLGSDATPAAPPAAPSPAGYDDEVGATQYRSVIAPPPATAAEPPAPVIAAPPAAAVPTTPVVAIPNVTAVPAPAPAPIAPVSVAPLPSEGDHDGETVMVEAPAPGDHDGHTIVSTDIAALRGRPKASPPPAAAPAPGAPVAVLVLSTGQREPLTQPILIGRAPSVSQVLGGMMPRLITVGGADQDISRTHARFALEGGTVVVTDLHSRNGTTIAMPGKPAQKLRAGEPTTVIVGTVVDLGGITVTVQED